LKIRYNGDRILQEANNSLPVIAPVQLTTTSAPDASKVS
jgi:hypothetical protein